VGFRVPEVRKMIRQTLWEIRRSTCREVTRLCSQAVDRRLTFHGQVSLCVHSLLCSYCRNYARQIRLLRRCVRHMNELADSTLQHRLPTCSASRIKKRLETETMRSK
jgi:hypothetical protein